LQSHLHWDLCQRRGQLQRECQWKVLRPHKVQVHQI
jgi:hypothetical protein